MANQANLPSRPFSRGLRGWDPFRSFQDEIERFFGDVARPGLQAFGSDSWSASLPVNVAETDEAIEIEAELPGIDERDIDVQLHDRVLTIKGERRGEETKEEKNYHIVERSYGAFARSLQLPFAAEPEAVSAKFDKGVLKIAIAKPKDNSAGVHKITVQGG